VSRRPAAATLTVDDATVSVRAFPRVTLVREASRQARFGTVSLPPKPYAD